MILLDTSGMLAAIDGGQRHHAAAARSLASATPPWVLSPFVLAEIDYLLATRVGIEAERALLGEVARGVYRLESLTADDVEAADRIIGRYADLGIGLADASIVVLASRYGVHDVLTLDERHFRALRAPGAKPFRVFPADT